MLRIEVEGDTLKDLIEKTAAVLGVPFKLNQTVTLDAPATPATEILAAARAVDEAPIVQHEQEKAVAAKGRGRPKKSDIAAPAGALSSVPAVQAQVTDNSASAPAGSTPTAEDAQATAAVNEAAAVVLSYDEFKAAMQDVQAAKPDNIRHVVAALNDAGYQKLRDVKPEHYAEIIVKARTYADAA